MQLAKMWRGVPLRQEVAVRAGGGGGRGDHPQQVRRLENHNRLRLLFTQIFD